MERVINNQKIGQMMETRHAINVNQIIIESELYRNGERIYNPIDLDESEFSDDQYSDSRG